MPLNRHQTFHLQAIIREANANKLESDAMRRRLAIARGVEIDDYIAYNDRVIARANDILASEYSLED